MVGSQLLQFDATGDEHFLEMGRENTALRMPRHVSDFGVHDHGFTNISTFGALRRLMNEGRIAEDDWERRFYQLALVNSGCVQACRWISLPEGGYIYSFNGPHSLFVDTIRSCRSLAVAHLLGARLADRDGTTVSLLARLIQHVESTAKYNVYYGTGRDVYDVPGRTAHEIIFNVENGTCRCPSTQQGYSPFSTWTRGLAWAICGFAELLEFTTVLDDEALDPFGGREKVTGFMLKAATATSDFYIANTPEDGIPYWDTGAPGLVRLGDYLEQPADPFNPHEPVDSSAATIATQGLMRLGQYLSGSGEETQGSRYLRAGLTIMQTLLREPYLSESTEHQGLILHSLYHRPRGWDRIPAGSTIPSGEATMWGDYHAREAAVYVQRIIEEGEYYTFFGSMADR